MGKYDIDKELYKQWFEEKTITIEKMETREQVEERIIEVSKMEFFVKREWAMLSQRYDKIVGRNSIAPWLQKERDGLITNPNIEVNWDGDPRKKEKKPKENKLEALLGIDLKAGMAELKAKKNKDKPISMDDAMSLLLRDSIPSESITKPKPTQEEIDSKATALKEKMRLAKEAALKAKEGQ